MPDVDIVSDFADDQPHLREVLRRVDEAVEERPSATITPLTHAPLIERAPALMPEAVLANYETTAKSVEAAADALEAEVQSQVALMREEAAAIRAQGELYAKSVESNSKLIRDVNRAFKEQFDKLSAVRMGAAA
jgi:hypothetical protein